MPTSIWHKNLQKLTSGIQVALRATVAAELAVSLAWLCRFEYPISALIASIIVTDHSPALKM
jgi:uncharacterized membrane protein